MDGFKKMNELQARTWLSAPRYSRFLDACEGDHAEAVALYDWHAELSMRTFGLIHHFEILLRNAIDRALGESQPQFPITETWLLDFEALRLDGIRQVIGAIGRLERGKVVTRDRVVAGLPFSFWTDLFGRRYEDLWRQRLHAAFPHGTLTRKEIGIRLKRIQRLRNRVAHHDSLLGQDVVRCLEEMLAMAAWIDPAAQGWLESRSDALETARQVT